MKKILAISALVLANTCHAADTAGLAGIVSTNDTVEVNGQINPRNIWVMYIANAPEEQNVLLAYVTPKKIGTHKTSVEWSDKNGKLIDKCDFDPYKVEKLPYIQTTTCRWGGRQPDGGLTFAVYNTFNGKKEKIGELFLPSKP